VLLVGYFLSSAPGTRGVCEDLAERLTARGWPVVTASSRETAVARTFDMVAAGAGLRGAYEVAVMDVYSGRPFLWAQAASAAVRLRGRPLILVLRGGGLPAFAGRYPLRVRRLLERADAVVSPSTYLRDAFLSVRRDLLLVPNALDWERYLFRPRSPARPRILWLRAFHEVYDPSLAPAVLSRIIEALPDATLRMAGPDRGDGSLARARQEVERLGLGARVEFVGPVRKVEIPELMAESDVYLNTSRVDNAPVTVVEALACGLCVVSTDVGGIRGLCAHGREAVLASAGDADALAKGVVDVVRDPALAATLSRGGRERAEAYRWSRILPRWEEILRSVALGRAPVAEPGEGVPGREAAP
jgi:glycosyltransferase involved in cell wall biosynthesis